MNTANIWIAFEPSNIWIAFEPSNIWIAFEPSNIWIAFEPSNNWIVRTKKWMFQFDCIWSRFWIQQTQILIIVELAFSTWNSLNLLSSYNDARTKDATLPTTNTHANIKLREQILKITSTKSTKMKRLLVQCCWCIWMNSWPKLNFLDKFDPILTSLVQLGQVWSNLDKFDSFPHFVLDVWFSGRKDSFT